MRTQYDVVVVGAGPNGLAAAITLAEAGCRVVVLEAKETIGGGTRTLPLTLPGFQHDICSAIHPLGVGSPFFRQLDLTRFGLEWIQPPAALAHPFDDGSAAVLYPDLQKTAETLGTDGKAYRRLMTPLIRDWAPLLAEILGPLHLPRAPLALSRFGLRAFWPAATLARGLFRHEIGRGFFAGLAAHAILPLEKPATAAFGLVLGLLGHAIGWPLPRGGSKHITDAMATYFYSLGGEIVTGNPVHSLADLPAHQVVLFDLTPRQILDIVGNDFPAGYRRRLHNYRYGPGVCKVDWALSDPIPWRNAQCRAAGTVHLGATLAEISLSEREVWQGRHAQKPYVIVVQQSLFDDSRAPAGKHTGWAYCHVPHGSNQDASQTIIAQIERFAPGFQDCILEQHITTASSFARYNMNYVGGDINGGAQTIGQLFTRPAPRLNPYTTPRPDIFICSSSTPPGGGVHGMCGYYAAQAALRQLNSPSAK
jgi:phytoene dehydrogenase-like protein